MNLGHLRVNYQKAVLTKSQLPKAPFDLFQTWFDQHRKELEEKPCYVEPNAVVLATCDPVTLRPSNRVVLLKGFDADGFVFYTN